MNKFIEKIGMDKVAHFGIGGLITALFTIVFILQDMGTLVFHPWKMLLYPFIGATVTAVASVCKEVFDGQSDKKDIIAALIGSALVFVAVFFGLIFYLGSN
jgi:hypothetical protein